jgi:hypothetical protein
LPGEHLVHLTVDAKLLEKLALRPADLVRHRGGLTCPATRELISIVTAKSSTSNTSGGVRLHGSCL